MKMGMIGLGRMGANMVRRLLRAGHDCRVHDPRPEAVATLAAEGAQAADSLPALLAGLPSPRIVWLMVPADAVDPVLDALCPGLEAGDILIDGGNSRYTDTMQRGQALGSAGIHFVDVGTSGGLWGLEDGYCLMLGGSQEAVQTVEPLLQALAPDDGVHGTSSAPMGHGTAGRGYLHCGPSGAGHYVKMVHNAVEYGLMAAYAEGMNLLQHATSANPGPPLIERPVADIAQLWRRGSVVRSWLLDLAARALQADPSLAGFQGRVADSGEGRWSVQAAVEAGVPVPVLSAALFARFSSRGNSAFGDKLLSALRSEFGGHREAPPGTP